MDSITYYDNRESYTLHHLARLEMMMADERGIDLPYIEALEIAKLTY